MKPMRIYRKCKVFTVFSFTRLKNCPIFRLRALLPPPPLFFLDIESVLGVHMCGCVFTVASWGVGSPHVLSELKGPAVILAERNMEADKGKDPCSPPPPKDKRDGDTRLKAHNHPRSHNGRAPVTSGIRGIGEGLSCRGWCKALIPLCLAHN